MVPCLIHFHVCQSHIIPTEILKHFLALLQYIPADTSERGPCLYSVGGWTAEGNLSTASHVVTHTGLEGG